MSRITITALAILIVCVSHAVCDKNSTSTTPATTKKETDTASASAKAESKATSGTNSNSSSPLKLPALEKSAPVSKFPDLSNVFPFSVFHSIISPNDKQHSCGFFEEWSDCVKCPKTCSEPDKKTCDEKCKEGCTCKEGFYKNSKNECVLLLLCAFDGPSKQVSKREVRGCEPNSSYDACSNFCVSTCRLPDRMCPLWITDCTPGCRCNEGYVRNDKNECVLVEDCKKCRN